MGRGHDSMGGSLPISRGDVTDWLNENEITDPAERREYRYFVQRLDLRWRILESRRQARVRSTMPGAKPEAIELDDPEDDGL